MLDVPSKLPKGTLAITADAKLINVEAIPDGSLYSSGDALPIRSQGWAGDRKLCRLGVRGEVSHGLFVFLPFIILVFIIRSRDDGEL